jgi:hypothetical protein
MGRASVRWIGVGLLILTSACTSVGSLSTKLQSVKTVGVISAIADEFTVTPAGLTGIDSDDRTVSIESWILTTS